MPKGSSSEKKDFQKGAIAIFAAVAITLLALGILVSVADLSGSGEKEKEKTSLVGEILNKTPEPTPFPFEELTIAYLRQRSYESSLEELQSLSSSSSYATYLTSYDSDGLKINGLLTIPNREEPEGDWPAIVFVHGYIPPSTYQTAQNYSDYVDYLARNGFVVFKIDLRGHGDSEGEAGGAYYSSDYIIDTLNAYSALQNADFVDPKRIGLWGHSMAGNVTFRSFVAKTDIPAIVIWAGAVYTYSDFSEYRISDDSYRPPTQDSERRRYRERLMQTYGEFSEDSEFWQKVVPTNYLEGVKGAVQLNHAINDPVVDIRYSRNLIGVLKDTPIEHELHEYVTGGHNITDPAFTQAMQNTVSFFDKYLSD